MSITIKFTEEEMTLFLEKIGFKISQEKRKFYRSVYHNDVEKYEQVVNIVSKQGKEEEVSKYTLQNNEAVKVIFEREFKKRLLEIVSNPQVK